MNSDAGLRKQRVCGLYLLVALIAAPGVRFPRRNQALSRRTRTQVPMEAAGIARGDSDARMRRASRWCRCAFLDSAGENWDCNRGYPKAAQAVSQSTSANAHADNSSTLRAGDAIAVSVRRARLRTHSPAHAFTVDTTMVEVGMRTRLPLGDGSMRGRKGPANAYPDDAGDGWKCEHGFRNAMRPA
jgi:hypothetical protein